MPQAETNAYDVAIVGYGPAGATLANLLARYGLRIAIVDQAAAIYDKPRAITIDHEVLRVFQACGLENTIAAHTAPHPGTHYLGVDGGIIKKFDPMPPPFPLGWVPTATFLQPAFEQALRDKLATYDKADVFLSAQAIGIAQDDDGTTLTIKAEDGAVQTLRARYLVGCDGANSFVRKALSIGLTDLAFDEWWMVVDALEHGAIRRPEKCFQYCRPSRPGTFLPGPGELRRWEIKLLPGEEPAMFSERDNVLNVLADFTDVTKVEIWRTAVYRFHALLAQEWQVGRIFLMGDACHQTPPFLGQGLSAGIRDAVNLAWKLALVLRGDVHASLLTTYKQERAPHVGAIVALAKDFGLIIGELDLEKAKARDARLRDELTSGRAETIRQKFIPDLAGGLIAKGTPAAGTLFLQPFIDTGSGVVRLDDLLAAEFLLVAASADSLEHLSASSIETWNRLRGVRVIIGADGLHETGSLFADWLASNGIAAAIVRPDRAVYGGARNAGELNALIETLAGSLSRPF
jgi:3-(3-hydroxy-phenyl)propionate hydroxylase